MSFPGGLVKKYVELLHVGFLDRPERTSRLEVNMCLLVVFFQVVFGPGSLFQEAEAVFVFDVFPCVLYTSIESFLPAKASLDEFLFWVRLTYCVERPPR